MHQEAHCCCHLTRVARLAIREVNSNHESVNNPLFFARQPGTEDQFACLHNSPDASLLRFVVDASRVHSTKFFATSYHRRPAPKVPHKAIMMPILKESSSPSLALAHRLHQKPWNCEEKRQASLLSAPSTAAVPTNDDKFPFKPSMATPTDSSIAISKPKPCKLKLTGKRVSPWETEMRLEKMIDRHGISLRKASPDLVKALERLDGCRPSEWESIHGKAAKLKARAAIESATDTQLQGMLCHAVNNPEDDPAPGFKDDILAEIKSRSQWREPTNEASSSSHASTDPTEACLARVTASLKKVIERHGLKLPEPSFEAKQIQLFIRGVNLPADRDRLQALERGLLTQKVVDTIRIATKEQLREMVEFSNDHPDRDPVDSFTSLLWWEQDRRVTDSSPSATAEVGFPPSHTEWIGGLHRIHHKQHVTQAILSSSDQQLDEMLRFSQEHEANDCDQQGFQELIKREQDSRSWRRRRGHPGAPNKSASALNSKKPARLGKFGPPSTASVSFPSTGAQQDSSPDNSDRHRHNGHWVCHCSDLLCQPTTCQHKTFVVPTGPHAILPWTHEGPDLEPTPWDTPSHLGGVPISQESDATRADEDSEGATVLQDEESSSWNKPASAIVRDLRHDFRQEKTHDNILQTCTTNLKEMTNIGLQQHHKEIVNGSKVPHSIPFWDYVEMIEDEIRSRLEAPGWRHITQSPSQATQALLQENLKLELQHDALIKSTAAMLQQKTDVSLWQQLKGAVDGSLEPPGTLCRMDYVEMIREELGSRAKRKQIQSMPSTKHLSKVMQMTNNELWKHLNDVIDEPGRIPTGVPINSHMSMIEWVVVSRMDDGNFTQQVRK